MAIDASVYNNLNTQPFNPLTTLANVQGIQAQQQQIQSAQLANQLTQAKFALGKYYTKNTHNGQVDYNGLQSDIASDPQTAMLLPQIQQEGRAALAPVVQFNPQTQQNMLMSTQEQQAALNPQRNIPQTPQPTQDQIDQAHDNLDYLGGVTRSMLNKRDLNLSDLMDNSATLAAEYAKSSGKRGLSTDQMMQEFGSLPLGPNGEEPNTQQLHQWLQNHYDNIMASKAAVTAAHGLPSNQQNVEQTNNVMPNQVQQNVAQANNQQEWASPHVAVSNPTDYDTRLTNSQGRIKQVVDEATAAPGQLAPFNKVLQLAKDIQTGPGADQINKIRTFLSAAGVGSDKMATDSATFDELKKYMNGIQQTAGEGKTNQYLDLLNSSNPNDKLLPQTIENVARFGAAQLQGKIAKQQVMRGMLGGTVTPAKEEAFNTMWNKIYDPRSIEFNMLNPAQQKDYLAKLSNKDAQKILESYDMLQHSGALQ